MKQYEIWWASMGPPVGRRPVLLLSRDEAYDFLNAFTVAAITRTIRGIPQEVLVGRREGLAVRSAVNLDQLHTLHVSQLERRAGWLAPSRVDQVKRALGRAWGWPELTLPA